MKLRIAKVRDEKGVSQRELAARVGATMSMIGKLERGERQMTVNWLHRIGAALDVSAGDLIDASDEPADVGTVLRDGEIYVDREFREPTTEELDGSEIFHVPSAQFSTRCAVTLQATTSVRLPADTRFIYTLPMQKPDRELSGRLAVIWADSSEDLKGSGQYVGYILAGSRADSFHVLPLSGELIEDIKIHSVALISEIELPQRTGGA